MLIGILHRYVDRYVNRYVYWYADKSADGSGEWLVDEGYVGWSVGLPVRLSVYLSSSLSGQHLTSPPMAMRIATTPAHMA